MAYTPKTVPTSQSVAEFLAAIEDPQRSADCAVLVKLMQKATGEKPALWGSSIVGFGAYHYVYESGHSGDSALVGFSPRKGDISIYITPGLDRYAGPLARLGKHKAGKVCLYVKRLSDIDVSVLEEVVEDLLRVMAPQRVKVKRVAA